jgi:hypothetical protein
MMNDVEIMAFQGIACVPCVAAPHRSKAAIPMNACCLLNLKSADRLAIS